MSEAVEQIKQTTGGGGAEQLERLLALRRELLNERRDAESPAVARALEMTDYYLFLALTYFGYSDEMCPEQAGVFA